MGTDKQPGLSQEEQALGFTSWADDYHKIRLDMLERAVAAQESNQPFSLGAYTEGLDAQQAERAKDVFNHLQRHGLLNFGAAPPPKQAAAEPPPEDPAIAAARQEKEAQNKLLEQLYKILSEVDLETVKIKDVREKLQEMGFDLSERKAFIKKYVDKFLSCRASGVEPEPVVSDDEGEQQEKARPPKVVVIGAGPAGLAAASTLHRCGVEVVVLEASEQAGGRSQSAVSNSNESAPPVDTAHLPLLPPHLMHLLQQPDHAAVGTEAAVQDALRLLKQLAQHQGVDLSAAVTWGSGGSGDSGGKSGGALIGIQDVPLFDASSSTWLTPEQLDHVFKVLEEVVAATKSQCEEVGEDGQYLTLKTCMTAALDKHVRKVSAAAAAAAKARAKAAAAAAKAAAPKPDKEGGAPQAPSGDTNKTDEAGVKADGGGVGVGGGGDVAVPKEVTAAGGEQEAGAQDEVVGSQPADSAAAVTGDQPSTAAAAPTAADDTAPATPAGHQGSDAAVVEAGQEANGGAAPSPAAAAAAGQQGGSTPGGKEETVAGVGSSGGIAAADAPPDAQPIPDVVIRGVRWLISMLHFHTATPLSSLPLTLAPKVTLLRHTPTSSITLAAGTVHLGILRPLSQRAHTGSLSQRLLAGLSRDLDVRYSQRVTEVRCDDEGVTVITKAGDKVEGTAVMVCVPLAVLKESSIKFRPSLPSWKQDLIGRLNPSNASHVGAALTTPLDLPTLLQPRLGAAEGGHGALPVFGVVPSLKTGQAAQGEVSCAMVCEAAGAAAGAGSVLLADTTSDGVVSKFQTAEDLLPAWISLLQKALPETATETASTWAVHPGQGAAAAGRATPSCDLTAEDMPAAVAPVNRTVFFAGEWCTSWSLLGSVAGALAAGVREAARVGLLIRDADSSLQVGDEEVVDEKALKAAAKSRQQKQQKAMLLSLKRQRAHDSDGDDDGDVKPAGKAAKKARKSKAAGSDDDDYEGEEEAGGKSKTKGRKRKAKGSDDEGDGGSKPKSRRTRGGAEATEPEPFDSVTYQQQLKMREEARQDIKAAHKALLQAAQGDVNPLLDIMQSAGSLDNRQQLLHVLNQATAAAVDALSQQPRYYMTVNTWLQELLDEKGSAEHLVVSLIKLLSRSTHATAAMLKTSGLTETFKTRCLETAPRDVRKIAQDLWQTWTQRFKTTTASTNPTAATARRLTNNGASNPLAAAQSAASTAAAARATPGAKPPGQAAAPGAGAGSARQPPPPQQQQQQAGKATTAAAAAAAEALAKAVAASVEEDPIIKALEEEERRLAAAIQEKQAAHKDAESTQPTTVPAIKLPAIRTFDEYQSAKIAARQDDKGRQRSTARPAAPPPPPPLASSAADALTGDGVPPLKDFISKLLKPAHVDKRITSSDFRDIRNKVLLKICDATPAAASDKYWLDGTGRKDKIKTLVDKYLQKT